MPSVPGLAASFWTMRLSFSPASMKAPSVRMPVHIALNLASSLFFSAAIAALASHGGVSMSSPSASRVPEVDGGP